jgi:hypothetical protein
LKTKAKENKFTTWYHFVTIPPGDSRKKLCREKRASANQTLLEAEDEERKQSELHPTKCPKPELPLVTQARVTLLGVDALPPQALCITIRIKYCQTEVLTCLIDSFCSAIWEFGLCEAVEGLQQEHRSRLSQSNYQLIGDWIDATNKHYLSHRWLVIRKLPHLRQLIGKKIQIVVSIGTRTPTHRREAIQCSSKTFKSDVLNSSQVMDLEQTILVEDSLQYGKCTYLYFTLLF